MGSYSEKLLINCVHSDPVGCMCIIYFLVSKFDTFSLLANRHDPENRFQKLNEIHRRRLSPWNCHTDSLTFVAKSHHCHQAVAMINNDTNDSLANWIVLWTPIQFCWSKLWGYSFSWEMIVTDLCPTLTAFSATHMGVRKSRKHIVDNRALIQIWIWWWRNCNQNCRR